MAVLTAAEDGAPDAGTVGGANGFADGDEGAVDIGSEEFGAIEDTRGARFVARRDTVTGTEDMTVVVVVVGADGAAKDVDISTTAVGGIGIGLAAKDCVELIESAASGEDRAVSEEGFLGCVVDSAALKCLEDTHSQLVVF